MRISASSLGVTLLLGATAGIGAAAATVDSHPSSATRQLGGVSYDGAYAPQYDGYACRTKTGHGSNGDEYVMYKYQSLSWCKEECYKTEDCKAFEYKVEGSYYKCEIWYEEPMSIMEKTGYMCWIKSEEGLYDGDNSGSGNDGESNGSEKDVELSVDYTWIQDHACRTGNGGTGSNGSEYKKYTRKSLGWCMAACDEQQDCKGFEYKGEGKTRCEIWKANPEKYASKSGVSCYVKRVN